MSSSFRFGLIGKNISYSKSPDIFQTIFKLTGCEGSFENLNLDGPQFPQQLKQLVDDGYQGLSVTIPYKRLVIPHLNAVDTIASALEAVNSIAITPDGLHGFNTDCYGFAVPLHEYAELLKHGDALIIGCGGGAKAVVYTLYTDFEISRFRVVGRSASRLNEFKESLVGQVSRIDLQTNSIDSLQQQPDRSYAITVNCTPLGGWNRPDESPLPESFNWKQTKVYYDLNYNTNNRAIRSAQNAGVRAIDGSSMLVGQAIRSFTLWTGRKVDFDPIYLQVFGNGSG
ncbi:MAG: shikimate dehydrogenase family protein [Candidatus Zixiibacteriota bacterium]